MPNITACVRSIFHGDKGLFFRENHALSKSLCLVKLRSSPSGSKIPFRLYASPKTGASLCGVVGPFVSGFASGIVSVARAVGAEVVTPVWVEEGGFEVIITRPMRALGVAVPVRADDEFVAAVYRVVHRSRLRLYLGRPN